MKEISVKDLKQLEMGILDAFSEYCTKHKLRYCLVCGTALGAVRHGGFIPWDDDIDVAMPRSDYKRFVMEFSHSRYEVCDWSKDKNYPYAFAKLCDKTTNLIEHIEHPCKLGVYIDVFPLDGFPADLEKGRKHSKRIKNSLRVLSWKRISPDKPLDHKHKCIQKIAKFILRPLPVSILVRYLDKLVQEFPYDESDYAGHFVTPSTWGNDLKPKSIFEPFRLWKFEDREYYVPGEVEKYLEFEYGDYKKLPPLEDRVNRHDFTAYYNT